ncbi:Signal transduction histidine kinase [Nonomuraea maritima]|uniref:histidine kinase n=1 Tax=Nonomuraea maritima TaxID=683260 RepID=A0A1G9D6K3_9ACTN|nr:histidine kinase [Nonomuraea maritima]SDK59542.1 Signal transduction histidine kinase [Nonomuraea maritima]
MREVHPPASPPPPLAAGEPAEASRDGAGDRLGSVLGHLLAALPLFCFALVGGLILVISAPKSMPVINGLLPSVIADMALGVAGLVLLRWRHRWPWQVALATALPTAISFTVVGPALVAFTSLATHRRWQQVAPIAVVAWLAPTVSAWLLVSAMAAVFYGVVVAAVLGAGIVFGLYLGGRRELADARREAEAAAQVQRVEQAKLEERLKIAQEMHDVLAHRMSLLAMFAGGLAHRKDLGPRETREVALAIQQNAHQSLEELRAVLGTLRHEDDDLKPPQPTLAQLDALFDEVRTAGQHVVVIDTVGSRELLPTQTGRHAYRIVQEALTNARKHAPGVPVRAELAGRPGDGLRIRVSNAALPGAAGPGGRQGLVGLAERTRLVGGTLAHAVHDGLFVLEACLPWEA